MAHFAKVINGVVEEVLVVDQEFIDSGALGDPSLWIKTSYNTKGGLYYTPNTNDIDPDQSKALRKNFAATGYIYDHERDAFYSPQPYPSWTLNEQSCIWEPPTPIPDLNSIYDWDEESQQWKKII